MTNQTHHLLPTSLRSHRASSHNSISSSLSAFSNNTHWGSESDYTEHTQSLHVDPRLFRAKEQDQTEEVEAVQPEKKKPRKSKGAAEKGDRKKVSHARKVSGSARSPATSRLTSSSKIRNTFLDHVTPLSCFENTSSTRSSSRLRSRSGTKMSASSLPRCGQK